MSQAMRKLTGAISKSRGIVIFINQIREKVGVMFGSPEVTPGGRALKFYTSVRIDVRRIESLRQGSESLGIKVRARVLKNKVAPPFRQAEFDLMYGKGISREGDLLDLGVEHGIVTQAGSWYSIGEERMGQGRENAKNWLVENPEHKEELEKAILEAVGLDRRLRPKAGEEE